MSDARARTILLLESRLDWHPSGRDSVASLPSIAAPGVGAWVRCERCAGTGRVTGAGVLAKPCRLAHTVWPFGHRCRPCLACDDGWVTLRTSPNESTLTRVAKTAEGYGRDPVLTEARVRKICDAVRNGSALEVSAKFAGVPKDTFWRWVREGRKPDGDPVYVKFVARLDKAHAECADARARAITGSEDWRASAFWLERRDPANWGKTTRIEGQVQHQAVPWLDLSKLAPGEIEQLRSLLSKARPEPADLPRGVDPAPLELNAGDPVAA